MKDRPRMRESVTPGEREAEFAQSDSSARIRPMDIPRLFDHDSETHPATMASRCEALEYCGVPSIVTCPSSAREQMRRKSRPYVDTVVKVRPTWSAGMRG